MISLFESLVPLDDPRVKKRQMFGNPCCFVSGNMFMGLFNNALFLRLGVDDREKFLGKGASIFEPMAGRKMTEYVSVPRNLEHELKEWVPRSLSFASSLPTKDKATRSKKRN